MQRKEETHPRRQARGCATKNNTRMVAQPAIKITRSDAWLAFAIAIATFAFVAWNEAGAAPAILGAVTSLVFLAILDFAFKGEWC